MTGSVLGMNFQRICVVLCSTQIVGNLRRASTTTGRRTNGGEVCFSILCSYTVVRSSYNIAHPSSPTVGLRL
jgi:hypothetical protein